MYRGRERRGREFARWETELCAAGSEVTHGVGPGGEKKRCGGMVGVREGGWMA